MRNINMQHILFYINLLTIKLFFNNMLIIAIIINLFFSLDTNS